MDKREIWIDWLRVSACFMVMLVHSTEPFYLGGPGALVRNASDAFWVAFFDSLARAAVPLFVIASSYLQFPIHYSTTEFFKRRALRILPPFIIWTLFYALWWGEPVQNLKGLLLNFNYAAGHLWFVYMLIGLYLLMPLLSPWAEKASVKEIRIYLGIWLLTTLFPYIREFASGGSIQYLEAADGLPAHALFPLWGEASWNAYGLFYYFSGFIGYLLLGLYVRKEAVNWSKGKSLGIGLPCLIAGFALCAIGFYHRIGASALCTYPVEGRVSLAIRWETPVNFNAIGVVLMAFGWILLFKGISLKGKFFDRILLPVSKASYGMYLLHMALLAPISMFLRIHTDSTPASIVLAAICTFVASGVLATLLRKIPVIGRYLIG